MDKLKEEYLKLRYETDKKEMIDYPMIVEVELKIRVLGYESVGFKTIKVD